ncbi:nitroreductase family protein [Opitutus sp. ER46]|uniref:nitroreductase family protein n=1 Tax=Opitutus sp. ER46 TaxID=2161864 RepID=UPI000D324E80|nr:nitroreductase family protein [Opitutus sp. ER46]PTX94417.1 hypothetical protein DB354_11750 [Opitutus sp. ER46]
MNSRRSFLQSAALLGAGVLVAHSARAQGAAASAAGSSAAPDFWTVVRSRRSVRRFKAGAPVPEEDVRRILEATQLSATSGNQQPWKFLVVRDPAKIADLKAACLKAALEQFDQHPSAKKDDRAAYEQRARDTYDGYLSAPVYIVLLTDNESRYPTYNHFDGPLAASTLMLAARALGYGTVFLTDSIPDSITKSVFKIPDRYTRVCITPIGVPEEWPKGPKKKPLDDMIVRESF